jgi:CrcB protein
MERFLWICFAGAIGTGTRYLIGLWAGQRLGTTFPYGTLIVNLLGCFLISFIMYLGLNLANVSTTLRMALTTGFLGGLTTYSSFNYETSKLMQDGALGVALLNLSVTLFGCFASGMLGLFLARRLIG